MKEREGGRLPQSPPPHGYATVETNLPYTLGILVLNQFL
jgi:hypothetical protein